MFWSPSFAIETSSTALSKTGYHPHYLQKRNNKATPTSQPTRNLTGPEAFRTCLHKAMQHHPQRHLSQFWESSKAPHTAQHGGPHHYLGTMLSPWQSGAVSCWHKEAVPKLNPAGSSSSRPCCLVQHHLKLQPYKHTAMVRPQPKPFTPTSN